MTRPRILVCVPVRGAIALQTVGTLVELYRSTAQVRFIFAENSDLPRTRAWLVETFLRRDETHLLFVDSDSVFDYEVVDRLLRADCDVIGVSFPRRVLSEGDVCAAAARGETPGAAFEAGLTFTGTWLANEAEVDGVVRVAHIGCGLMLIKRAVLERMQMAYAGLRFPLEHGAAEAHTKRLFDNPLGFGCTFTHVEAITHLFHPMIDAEAGPIGEDYAFCERWSAIGGHIHVLRNVRVGHVGEYVFRGTPPPIERTIE